MDLKIMPPPTPKTTPPSTSPSPRKENVSKRRTPKKGRDIGNNIFCKFCKYLIWV
jgi:hypothetical protein